MKNREPWRISTKNGLDSLAIVAAAVLQSARYWYWKNQIEKVNIGMGVSDVIDRLGPLPPRFTIQERPEIVETLTSAADAQYCVDYFFFNGGPSVDLCFDSNDTVVHKRAYQWSFIHA